MTIWVDAQLPPQLATWIRKTFEIEALAVRDLGLRDAKDIEIFEAARQSSAIVLTKDKDFVTLLERFGPPPQIIWVTLGNTSNQKLKDVLKNHLSKVLKLLGEGEPLVEILEAQ